MTQLQQQNLKKIITACQTEAQNSRWKEQGYCFELFRRALDQNDEHAWLAIQSQYQRLVLGWIYERLPTELSQLEAEEMAATAFVKFWRSLNKNPQTTERFPHVGALLKYLYQCAMTTLLDYKRRQQRYARLKVRLHTMAKLTPALPTLEEQTLNHLSQVNQLAQVQAWMSTAITDPQEKLVLALSYEQQLTPAQIAKAHPNEFENAAKVRRIKERFLKRARRALADTLLMSNGGK